MEKLSWTVECGALVRTALEGAALKYDIPSVCRNHTQREAYDDSWHLVIPPVMTLLDDYEARYKLRGVAIVSVMLQNVPKGLLKRTGVDGLIRSVRQSRSILQRCRDDIFC